MMIGLMGRRGYGIGKETILIKVGAVSERRRGKIRPIKGVANFGNMAGKAVGFSPKMRGFEWDWTVRLF